MYAHRKRYRGEARCRRGGLEHADDAAALGAHALEGTKGTLGKGTKAWHTRPTQVATQMVDSYPCLETDTNASTPAYDDSGHA